MGHRILRWKRSMSLPSPCFTKCRPEPAFGTLSDGALCPSEGRSEKTRAERGRQHRALVGPGSPPLSLPPLTTVQEV